jgi:hypothetical protein
MTPGTYAFAQLTDEAVARMFQRAFRNTLILGAFASVAVEIGAGWRSAAMLLTGTLISAASIWEWRRMVRVISARLDNKKTPTSALWVFLSFVLRLTVFAAALYGSLRCFRGSVVALLCGLVLAVLTLSWEAIRLLRD